MAKLYSNENFPQPVIDSLRKLGHDVLTSADVGNANLGISDEDVLQFAIGQERIMITLNRKHFIRLHLINANHFGIIVCKLDLNFEQFTQRIHEILITTTSFENQLIRINRPTQ